MSSLTVRSVFVRFPSHPDSIEVITNGALGWLAGRQSVGRFPSLSEVGLGSRPTEKRCQRQLPKLSPASRVPSVKSPKRGQRTHCTSESVFKLIQNPSGIFMLQNPSQGLEFKSNELGKLWVGKVLGQFSKNDTAGSWRLYCGSNQSSSVFYFHDCSRLET